MEDNTMLGAARNIGGRIESAASSAGAEIGSRARELGGLAQDRYEDANDRTQALVAGHSLTALLAAGALGLTVGFFLNRR